MKLEKKNQMFTPFILFYHEAGALAVRPKAPASF